MRQSFLCRIILAAFVWFATHKSHSQETNGDELIRLEGHTGPVMAVSASKSNDMVFSGSSDGSIRIWPLKDGKSDGSHSVVRHPARGQMKSVSGLDLSCDERLLASSGFDGRIGVWRLDKGKASPLVELAIFTNLVALVKFSPDSKVLAAVQRESGRICLWAIAGDKLTQSAILEASGFQVWSLGFAPDARHMAVGVIQTGVQKSGAVWVWDMTTSPPTNRVLLAGLGLPRSVTFSPDGRHLAYGDGNTIRMVDVESGKESGAFNGHTAGKSVVAIAFSPDGKNLLSGGYDDTIRYWNVSTKQELQMFEGNFQGVEDVEFAGAGRIAVSATKDNLVRIWRLDEQKGTAKAASHPSQKSPVSGEGRSYPKLDGVMARFVDKINCTAGALAVSKDGRLLYSRGYGWLDREHLRPAPPNVLIGIASCEKPMTASAVRVLSGKRKLKLDEQIFQTLDIRPGGAVVDPRVNSITVLNVLDHKAGWGGDIYGRLAKSAEAAGMKHPFSMSVLLGQAMCLRLEAEPGKVHNYSNFGYDALRYLVEVKSGEKPGPFFRETLLKKKSQDVGQPWEAATAEVTCRRVWNLNAGGPVYASAPYLTDFMREYWMSGQPRAGNGQFWVMYGSLDGSTALMLWRGDGLNVAALFNGRNETTHDSIKAALEQALVAEGLAK